jgi:GDP-mannose 6-dehydrogenase
MNIGVVGLGYVGAVSCACLAEMKHSVWGVDINTEKVRIINEGRSPIVESGLAAKIAQAPRLDSTSPPGRR